MFHPNDPRDFTVLVAQKEELRAAVFDPDFVQKHDQYISFWKDLSQVPGAQPT